MFETSDRIPETEYILELLIFGGVGTGLNVISCLINQGKCHQLGGRFPHCKNSISEVGLDMNFEPSTEPRQEMWLLKVSVSLFSACQLLAPNFHSDLMFGAKNCPIGIKRTANAHS